MKTVITASGDNLAAAFDKRFGRAAYFCLHDEETGSSEFIENGNMNAGHGAGTKAAEKMVELNVQKIISGDFGPKAKELLEKFNIQMVIIQDDNLTVQDVINKLKSN
jgi:predicted Fe-Mo cluster-binding NifX family protein